MKLSGKIVINGMNLPEKSVFKAQDIQIDYEVHFAPDEVLKLINIIDVLPQKIDIIAESFKKVLEYEKEFDHTENTPVDQASKEVDEAKKEVASAKDK